MLDKIRILNPCDADWDTMKGDNKSRFCERCQKTVYNLSAMTETEATQTVCGPGDPPCVRYAVMSDGRVFTTDRRPRWALTAGLMAAAGLALAQDSEARDWLWQRMQPACTEVTEPASEPQDAAMIPEMQNVQSPPRHAEMGKPVWPATMPMVQGGIRPMPVREH